MFKHCTKPTYHSFTHTGSACQAVSAVSTAANGGRLDLQAPKWPFIGTDRAKWVPPYPPLPPGTVLLPLNLADWVLLKRLQHSEAANAASERVSSVKPSQQGEMKPDCVHQPPKWVRLLPPEQNPTQEDSINKCQQQKKAAEKLGASQIFISVCKLLSMISCREQTWCFIVL